MKRWTHGDTNLYTGVSSSHRPHRSQKPMDKKEILLRRRYRKFYKQDISVPKYKETGEEVWRTKRPSRLRLLTFPLGAFLNPLLKLGPTVGTGSRLRQTNPPMLRPQNVVTATVVTPSYVHTHVLTHTHARERTRTYTSSQDDVQPPFLGRPRSCF